MPSTPAGRRQNRKAEPQPKSAGPCVLVIFGITGDLAKRLLFPALYNLAKHKFLPERFAVVGFALAEMNEQQVRDSLASELKQAMGPDADTGIIQRLVSRLKFIAS